MEENQGEQERHFEEREGIRVGAWGRKGGFHSEGRQVLERKEGEQAKRASLRESVSERKSSPAGSGEFWGFAPSLAKSEMEKEVGRRRARS